MSGTKAGGLKAAITNKQKHGEDFYANIGRKGGQNGHTGGFSSNRALAKLAGAKGGRKSRRGPARPAGMTDEQWKVELEVRKAEIALKRAKALQKLEAMIAETQE